MAAVSPNVIVKLGYEAFFALEILCEYIALAVQVAGDSVCPIARPRIQKELRLVEGSCPDVRTFARLR